MPERVFALVALAAVMALGQIALGFGEPENLAADAAAWRVMPSDGVVATISAETHGSGSPCPRLDFDFTTGGGFVVVQRDFVIDLPENYEFAFRVKGGGVAEALVGAREGLWGHAGRVVRAGDEDARD